MKSGFGRAAIFAAAVLISLHASANRSIGQEVDPCVCLVPTGPDVAIGRVQLVEGDVMMSQPATGYSQALQGAPIVIGARLIVGPQSSTTLGFGDMCALVAPASSTVKVDASQAGTCVSLEMAQLQPSPVVTATEKSGLGLGGLAAGVLVVGAGAGVALAVGTGDDDSASD